MIFVTEPCARTQTRRQLVGFGGALVDLRPEQLHPPLYRLPGQEFDTDGHKRAGGSVLQAQHFTERQDVDQAPHQDRPQDQKPGVQRKLDVLRNYGVGTERQVSARAGVGRR